MQSYDDPYKVTQFVGTLVTRERRGKQVIREHQKWKVIIPSPDYSRHKRRRTPEKKLVIPDYSSKSEENFDMWVSQKMT